MNRKKLRLILGPIIIAATIGIFTWYIIKHPAVLDQLRNTSPILVAILIVLYFGVLLCLMGVTRASLKFYHKTFGVQENFLFNAYSSLINFFGPGQSGPGFRGVYLKLKHGLGIKQYIFITLVYYAYYAIISGALLFAVSRPWWQSIILLGGIILGCIGIIALFMRKNRSQLNNSINLHSYKLLALLGLATLLQVACTSAIYYAELHSLDGSINLSQALAYTGAANFALFVAITPGAIGIREAFLVFTQNLHHIPNNTIVAANVLDRAVNLAFLGLLFILVLSMHAGKKLQVNKVRKAAAATRE